MKHEREIRVLVVAPGEAPVERTIDNSLSEKQAIVGGWIQVVDLDEKTVLICNEEGKLLGLPLNRLVGNDVIVGNFLICGVDNETGEFASMTEQQIEKYKRYFTVPEIFITADRRPSVSRLEHGRDKNHG